MAIFILTTTHNKVFCSSGDTVYLPDVRELHDDYEALVHIKGTTSASVVPHGKQTVDGIEGAFSVARNTGVKLLTDGASGWVTVGGTFSIASGGAVLKFPPSYVSAGFTVTGSSGSLYLITAASTITASLPQSPADGTIYKFKRVSGNGDVILSAFGGETIDNAGTIDSTLTLGVGISGVVELIAVVGGWIVT